MHFIIRNYWKYQYHYFYFYSTSQYNCHCCIFPTMSCKKMAIYYVLYYIPIDRRDVSSLDFAVVLNRTLTIYSPFLSLFNFLNNSIQFIFLLQLWDPLYDFEEDNPVLLLKQKNFLKNYIILTWNFSVVWNHPCTILHHSNACPIT